MFYLGSVTPKQFINRLSKHLKQKASLPTLRKCFGEDSARLIIPIQGDSRFIIRVSASIVDCGHGLHIEMDFRELIHIPHSSKIHAQKDADWHAIILSPYEHKRLRSTCLDLANKIYCHIDCVEGMQSSDFFDFSFVDEP